jgi:hypothetical protein
MISNEKHDFGGAHVAFSLPLTIVELKGGMGNQLFQFAAGLRRVRGQLSALHFNVSYYDHDAKHGGFVLDRLFPTFQFKLTKAKKFNVPTAYLNFDNLADAYPAEVFDLSCPIYLSGYFQNINLVDPVLPFLRQLFKEITNRVVQSRASDDSDFLATFQQSGNEEIRRKHIIGVHMRRGDYLLEATASEHGIPDVASIVAALDREIEAAGGKQKTEVLLFTDSKELSFPFDCKLFSPFESRNKVHSDIEEFVAMSHCDALVCSNSSFSYWAGLLSTRMKRQYLPSIWMKSGAVKTESLVSNQRGMFFRRG